MAGGDREEAIQIEKERYQRLIEARRTLRKAENEGNFNNPDLEQKVHEAEASYEAAKKDTWGKTKLSDFESMTGAGKSFGSAQQQSATVAFQSAQAQDRARQAKQTQTEETAQTTRTQAAQKKGRRMVERMVQTSMGGLAAALSETVVIGGVLSGVLGLWKTSEIVYTAVTPNSTPPKFLRPSRLESVGDKMEAIISLLSLFFLTFFSITIVMFLLYIYTYPEEGLCFLPDSLIGIARILRSFVCK